MGELEKYLDKFQSNFIIILRNSEKVYKTFFGSS